MTSPSARAIRAAWRQLRRPWALIALLAVGWALSGLYVVDKRESGVLTAFGRVLQDRVPPGLHYRLPWPMTAIRLVDTSTTHTMSVGFKIRDMVLGIPTPPAESQWLTGDTNIIEVRMVVQYRATDPARYLLATEDPDLLVRHAGESVVTDLVGHTAVEQVMTHGRGDLLAESQRRIQGLLDDWGCGIAVTSINFEAIEPPREVVDAFHAVQSAKADSQRMHQEAEAYANTVLPEARGEASSLLSAARSHRERRVAQARGWTARFEALADAHKTAPRATRVRLYLESVERTLSSSELVIVDPGAADDGSRTVLVRTEPGPDAPHPTPR